MRWLCFFAFGMGRALIGRLVARSGRSTSWRAFRSIVEQSGRSKLTRLYRPGPTTSSTCPPALSPAKSSRVVAVRPLLLLSFPAKPLSTVLTTALTPYRKGNKAQQWRITKN